MIHEYLVVCDESNNTPESIAKNELHIGIVVRGTPGKLTITNGCGISDKMDAQVVDYYEDEWLNSLPESDKQQWNEAVSELVNRFKEEIDAAVVEEIIQAYHNMSYDTAMTVVTEK